MNKFTVAEMPVQAKPDEPVLYKLHIGSKYFLYKGKVLHESVNRLLDDVFRGIRGKACPESHSLLVEYCKRYPALHRVMIDVVLNDTPAKVLAAEEKEYKRMKNDECSLNRLDLEPYKPEWMVKAKFQEKCEKCATSGTIDGKKTKFRFCPSCGRLNK